MKILLLDPRNTYGQTIQAFPCLAGDATIITGEQVDNYSSESTTIDIIIGGGDLRNGSRIIDQLLTWRTHPYTYLVPCWIVADRAEFASACLWPRLAIDRFGPDLLDQEFCSWLEQVAEWQQTRLHLEACNTLQQHSTLELITSLALRKASGKLTVFDEEGGEGFLVFRSACLAEGHVKHLRGMDALFEFMAWSQGSYCWESSETEAARDEDLPLDLLLQDGLRLLRDANLLYHFLPDLHQPLHRTDSQSALHDGAAPFFAARKEIYHLIDGGITVAQLLEASPVSRPRTMSLLAEWFSLGDISFPGAAVHEPPTPEIMATPGSMPELMVAEDLAEELALEDRASLEAALYESVQLYPDAEEAVAACHRLLIVDDSALMCRALQEIFSNDRRFEIVGVARDGVEALALIDQLKPDVITLDIQMPRMDGLTALKHIMVRDPRPVVILSAFTKETSQLTYESFKYGAVDVCTKPVKGNLEDMEAERQDLRDRVAQAACVHLEAARYIRRGKKLSGGLPVATTPLTLTASDSTTAARMVVIGCGAGGFPALLKLLFAYSWDDPGVATIVSMAMPGRVVEALLPNLERDCTRKVVALTDGTHLESGVFYLHSIDSSFRLVVAGGEVKAETDGDGCCLQAPINHLLCAAAQLFGERMNACILSGVGEDGLAGLQAVRQEGGRGYVLTPQMCLKPELPRRILEQSSAEEIRTITEMARRLWGMNQNFDGHQGG